MANPLVPKPIVSQSADNTDLIIVDGSNYQQNDDNVHAGDVTLRTLNLYGDNSQLLFSFPLTDQGGGVFGATWPITKDVVYKYQLVLTVGQQQYIGYVVDLSNGYYETNFLNIMKNNLGDCGCKKPNVCSDLTWATHNYNAAVAFAKREMITLAQESIDAANSFLNDILNN